MRARGGFSLIELLCTVAIILILAVLMAGRGSASAEKKSRAGCQANLQKIYLALSIYATDNKGAYPMQAGATNAESVLSLLVPSATTLTEIFICPASDDKELPESEPFGAHKISYAYYMGRGTNDEGGAALISDAQVNSLPKTAGQALFSADGKSRGNNHGKLGGNLLQANGEIQFSGPVAERDLPLPAKVVLLNPK